jgi:tRNA (mo5U34)-methyltransferase
LDGSGIAQSDIDRLRWFHSMDFNGPRSVGQIPEQTLKNQAALYFRNDLVKGKSFLDVGCWDGFNSFEAVRRGASRVLATDFFAWREPCWGQKEAFELARSHFAPSVAMKEIAVEDLTSETVGMFDVVLFAGVLYHLRNPFAGLEQVSKLVKETLILETHVDGENIKRPAMIFYPTTELDGDPTNWWGPNTVCVQSMLNDLGFRNIETIPHPNNRRLRWLAPRRRMIFRASRASAQH